MNSVLNHDDDEADDNIAEYRRVLRAAKLEKVAEAARGRGTGSESSVSEELRGCAEIATKNGWTEWAAHLIAKADALDAALARLDAGPAFDKKEGE